MIIKNELNKLKNEYNDALKRLNSLEQENKKFVNLNFKQMILKFLIISLKKIKLNTHDEKSKNSELISVCSVYKDKED